MRFGKVEDYLLASKYCGLSYEQRLVKFIRDAGNPVLADKLEREQEARREKAKP